MQPTPTASETSRIEARRLFVPRWLTHAVDSLGPDHSVDSNGACQRALFFAGHTCKCNAREKHFRTS